MSDLTDVAGLWRNLPTSLIGKTILFFSRTTSTNTVAKEMAQRGAPAGTVVIADYQSAGHGRRGRVWLADPGDALLLSVILRPPIPPAEAFYLTMVPALAAAEALRAVGVPEVALKWPNDVLIGGRKVAGILTELSLRGPALDFVVVGIGLNVRLDAARHPEISMLATSVAAEIGRPVERAEVARRLLVAFELYYLALEAGQGPALFEAWRASLSTLGRWVLVGDLNGRYLAYAEDVTPDGGLVLRRDGERLVVYGGEVTLAR